MRQHIKRTVTLESVGDREYDHASDEPDSEAVAKPEEPQKNPAAVALGRMGGLKGGAARAQKLSKKRRAEIAKKAAKARWSA